MESSVSSEGAKSKNTSDSGVVISSSAHSSFSSRDSSSLLPHTTAGAEDSQEVMASLSVDPAMMTSSIQKRSKSLSEFSRASITKSSLSAHPFSFGYTTESQVNTTSGIYNSPPGNYAIRGGYQTQSPFSLTYSKYSTGALHLSSYLVHLGPPRSSLYSMHERCPPLPLPDSATSSKHI